MAVLSQRAKAKYLACAQALAATRTNLDHLDEQGIDISLPVFSVSQVAQLADIHPQTLRQYDRLGLIVPERTEGGARRYSLRDIDRLYQAQHLSQDESINIAGIRRILDLSEENRQLLRQIRRMNKPAGSNVFEAGMNGEIVEVERACITRLWSRQENVYVHDVAVQSQPNSDTHSKSLVLWTSTSF